MLLGYVVTWILPALASLLIIWLALRPRRQVRLVPEAEVVFEHSRWRVWTSVGSASALARL
jgi:hypothetical protein